MLSLSLFLLILSSNMMAVGAICGQNLSLYVAEERKKRNRYAKIFLTGFATMLFIALLNIVILPLGEVKTIKILEEVELIPFRGTFEESVFVETTNRGDRKNYLVQLKHPLCSDREKKLIIEIDSREVEISVAMNTIPSFKLIRGRRIIWREWFTKVIFLPDIYDYKKIEIPADNKHFKMQE